MTKVKARIPVGNTVHIQEVELFTVDEAKEILKNHDWEIGGNIYSVEQTNKAIGWLAEFKNGDGIFVEVKH